MKIYQIDSSARKDGSTSRALAKKLLDKIKKPSDEIIYRDLDDEMVFVSGLTESGMKIDVKDQTEHQILLHTYIQLTVSGIAGEPRPSGPCTAKNSRNNSSKTHSKLCSRGR